MAPSSKSVLLLKLSAEGNDFSLELKEGKKILIGRSAQCIFKLTASNVSTEHLEIYYKEGQVRIRDLNSANGTFRLPAKAPFVEVLLSPKNQKLELLLAKTPIVIEWNLKEEDSEANLDKTVPINLLDNKTVKLGPEPAVDPIPLKVEAKKNIESLLQESSAPLPKSQAETFSSIERKLEWASLVPWSIFFILNLSLLIVFRKQSLGPILENNLTWTDGLGWDLFIMWYWKLKTHGIWFLLPVAIFGTLSFAFKKKHWPLAEHFNWNLKMWIRALLLLLLMALSPWLYLFVRGASPLDWARVVSLVEKLEDQSLDTKAKHALFKDLLPKFKGSSYFYVQRFKVQTKRVLEECGGVGEKPWESKRVCLLLLHAVGVENLEDFAPGYYNDLAHRISLILSLDGMHRTLMVEGKDSQTINYFLNSLSLVGLEEEMGQIRGVLFEKGLNETELLNVLHDLRLSLEERLQDRFKELKVPRLLILKIPAPIELGI